MDIMPQENPQLQALGTGIINMAEIDFNYLLTAQEHALFGSTVDKKYQEKPHTPLTVVDGKISVKKCNEQRKRFPSLDSQSRLRSHSVNLRSRRK